MENFLLEQRSFCCLDCDGVLVDFDADGEGADRGCVGVGVEIGGKECLELVCLVHDRLVGIHINFQ